MTRVIYNGKIYHGVNRQGVNRQGDFCQALRIEGGRIRALGDSEELLAALPAGAETIDAAGALVLPGFHDSHLHLHWLGRYAGMVDGTGADSVEDLIRRGRALIARDKPLPGTYVQGGGVNPDLFTAEKRDLNREDLDRVSSEHPVIMSRHCGHTIYCNSLALRMAGLAEHAPDVEGGTIEKDGAGRPTGVLRENAAGLIRRLVPEPTRAQMRENLKRAMTTALSLGITALGTNDSQGPDYDEVTEVYRSIYAEAENGGRGAGFPRVSLQCGISADEAWLDHVKERGGLPGTALWEGERGVFLRMGSVKLFMDGTLGGQTAWMTEPYRDKPETRGFPVLEEEQLRAFVRRAASYNMQVIVHAIGDAAMEAVISALEEVTGPGANPLRHGIVHCQITRRAQLERMARNQLLALVQPVFLADDMCILESRVGPGLASGSYAWGTMERLGLPVSYGTDAPVSDLNPLLGISWAVTRQDPRRGFYPPGGFCPAERVDLAAAVDAYTAASAYAAFAERELGRAAPGFWADLCFIDRDIFSLPPGEIHRAQVIRTMIAGDTVWEA
ncbi:MAG: amidohydrolase [Treponema sp.]|jgi:predicted amidohydrolase YtcJ|nr:amidohydrolase [Treponema sp.]